MKSSIKTNKSNKVYRNAHSIIVEMLEETFMLLACKFGVLLPILKIRRKKKEETHLILLHINLKKSCPSSQLSETTSQQKVSFLLLLPRWSKSRVKNDPTARCKKTPLLKPGCSRSLVCCRNNFIRKECRQN